MTGFKSILKRELKSYFSTPLSYLFMVAFLLAALGWTFYDNFFEMRQADLRVFFSHMPVLFLLMVPAIGMRLWAEERRSNTVELLFTLPITTMQAVLGKFFAAWTVLGISLVMTFPIVWTVCWLGDPDPGPIITGYIGSFLLAGVYLTIGSFFSVLTRSQVVAFILGVAFCLIGYIIGSPPVMQFLSGETWTTLRGAMENLSFYSRFESIQRGVLSVKDLSYFAILLVGGLWANIVLLEERKAA